MVYTCKDKEDKETGNLQWIKKVLAPLFQRLYILLTYYLPFYP